LKIALLVFLTFNFASLFFSGCGYKPTSHYAKHEIKGNVFVRLKVDINNATNSVIVKDAVNEMVVNQFGAILTNNKNIANTIIDVTLDSVSFKTLQDDNQGYAKLYRTTVGITLKYLYKGKSENISKSINVSGSYDYSVDPNSLITDSKKQEAVKIAAQKALSEIFSKIAVQSFKNKKSVKQKVKKTIKQKDANKTNKSKSFFFFN
jgi:hypothetical protein